MTEQLTKVVTVQGTQLTVAIDTAACGGCRSKSACATPSTRALEISPELAARLRPGDAVVLSVPDGATIHAAALAYLLPLCGFLTGLAVASAYGQSDGAGLLASAGGLTLGFMVARLISQRLRRSLSPEVCTSSH